MLCQICGHELEGASPILFCPVCEKAKHNKDACKLHRMHEEYLKKQMHEKQGD